MTKIFVFLTDSLADADLESVKNSLLKTPLSESVSLVLQRKNREAQIGSLAVRALLFGAYSWMFGAPPPPLKKTGRGAPYLGRHTRISLSHTRGAVALAITDERHLLLGVDIEPLVQDTARLERVQRRFLGGLSDGKPWDEAEVFLARLVDRDTLSFEFAPMPTVMANDTPISRFTRAEAILKSTGRGFSDLSRLPALSRSCAFRSVEIPSENGTPYILSYATRLCGVLSFLKRPRR